MCHRPFVADSVFFYGGSSRVGTNEGSSVSVDVGEKLLMCQRARVLSDKLVYSRSRLTLTKY